MSEADDSICPHADDGKHRPEGDRFEIEAGEDLVAHVTCANCGRSGSATIGENDVLW